MTSDFTFAKDDTHRFLPWQIGIMVALATLLLSLVLSLSGWAGAHHEDYADSISVIIPGSLEKLDEKTEQVKTLLAKDKAIAGIKQLSEKNLRDLLAPWIGSGDALMDMPLPVVLDITLDTTKPTFNADTLRKSLSQIEPTIELDTHNSWAEVFSSFIRILQWLAALLVVAILGAMTLLIAFSARASLHLHERTVNILHGLGAEDGYIARQFQNDHFKIGFRAACIGVAAAALAYALLGQCVAMIHTAALPSFDFSGTHVALLLLMPFACALIVLIATRAAVLTQLRKVL